MATLDELQRDHPDWHVVSVIDAPGGGQWAVGADGGVFALGGAAYLGSYTGLDPTQRQGARTFTGIQRNDTGYSLISNRGEFYNFNAPASATTTGTTTATTSPPTGTIDVNSPTAQSAKAQIASTLVAVGLPATLADSLWNDLYIKQGRPIQTIIDVDLPNTDEFKTRFPAFGDFQKQTGGTVADYITTTNSYKGALKAAGLPDTFYDQPSDFAKWISGGVSPKEVSDRITLASQAALTAPPEVRDFLVNQEGLSPGDLAAFFLDSDKGDLVQAQARYQQAQIGGAAARSGFGQLSLAEAQQLQQAGVTGDQATQRFGLLSQEAPLFSATAGEAETGSGLTRADALGAAANTGDALKKIARTQAARQAAFEGGGGAAGSGSGSTGLGAAGS